MMESLVFGGFYLTSINGFYWDSSQTFDKPSRDVIFYEVPGRNGDLSVSRNRFNNLNININCWLEDFTFFDALMSALYSLDGYRELQLGSNPTTYRIAQFVEAVVPKTTQFNQKGEFTLVFNCKPQRFFYPKNEEWLSATSGANSIQYLDDFSNYARKETMQVAKPLVSVLASNCPNVVISSKSGLFNLNLSGIDERVYIDSENEIVYYIDNNNKVYLPSSNYNGNFPAHAGFDNPSECYVQNGTGSTSISLCNWSWKPNWWII